MEGNSEHQTYGLEILGSQWSMSDLEALYNTARISVGDLAWPISSYLTALEAGDYCLVLKSPKKSFTGFLLAKPNPDGFEILDVHVVPSLRGQGFGRLLLQQFLRDAKDQQAAQILLEVGASNTIAQALYRGLGFKQIGLRKNYYAQAADKVSRDAFVMQLVF